MGVNMECAFYSHTAQNYSAETTQLPLNVCQLSMNMWATISRTPRRLLYTYAYCEVNKILINLVKNQSTCELKQSVAVYFKTQMQIIDIHELKYLYISVYSEHLRIFQDSKDHEIILLLVIYMQNKDCDGVNLLRFNDHHRQN